MPTFTGINHLALTVTDLDVSQRFYTEVLDFLPVLDIGHGRVCLHKRTGFTIALLRPEGATGSAFSELATGLDHLGLAAADRGELEQWEGRLHAAGVACTPIVDTLLGHHLNFRDPDGIALELHAPTELYAGVLADLRSRDVPDAEVLALAAQALGPELAPRPPGVDPSTGT